MWWTAERTLQAGFWVKRTYLSKSRIYLCKKKKKKKSYKVFVVYTACLDVCYSSYHPYIPQVLYVFECWASSPIHNEMKEVLFDTHVHRRKLTFFTLHFRQLYPYLVSEKRMEDSVESSIQSEPKTGCTKTLIFSPCSPCQSRGYTIYTR